ncbi:hypothetical protein ADK66_19620 [Micromonospora sp. NRRL B-16802]|nr:hypothetical protein ADK66_19620 [Micromonospora sp. NRRL B-16802]
MAVARLTSGEPIDGGRWLSAGDRLPAVGGEEGGMRLPVKGRLPGVAGSCQASLLALRCRRPDGSAAFWRSRP